MLLPLAGLLVGVLAGLVLQVNVSFELSRYSAVAILAALDSVLGAVRAELDGVYDNRIFISGFVTNAIVAVILTFIGDRLSRRQALIRSVFEHIVDACLSRIAGELLDLRSLLGNRLDDLSLLFELLDAGIDEAVQVAQRR